MSIRTLIVDDEVLARKRIRKLLASEADVEIIGECGDGLEAVAMTRRLTPELVFLDVQMPNLSGIEVLEKLELDSLPAVIFVTAYDSYTLDAFNFHAVDYLLKPYSEERFRKAIARVRERIGSGNRNNFNEHLRALLANLKPEQKGVERLVVAAANDRLILLKTDEVDWIEAQGNYLRVHAKRKTYLLRETMSNLTARVAPSKFVRIHRSTVVNIDRIKELRPMFSGQHAVILHDDTELTLSRNYRDNLLNRFNA